MMLENGLSTIENEFFGKNNGSEDSWWLFPSRSSNGFDSFRLDAVLINYKLRRIPERTRIFVERSVGECPQLELHYLLI